MRDNPSNYQLLAKMPTQSRIIRRTTFQAALYITILVTLFTILATIKTLGKVPYVPTLFSVDKPMASLEPLIIVITPTYKRPTRLADMTRTTRSLENLAKVDSVRRNRAFLVIWVQSNRFGTVRI
ncbi:hypothetical protein KIN20_016710 [Parelaphostrongylus tenuis]|uniref:Uncharacterized protein n=1 Tax=Parelaphostrongylus tenuis TaxID=148309 RepID=A0AAD5MM00_PARTN|nr:hypothetical protein KIN20_016710 [Parelaphostrongylus tenuis]